MLQKIRVKNFKSIVDDTLELGRVNVFIGENGCGKSNILEAVAFAGTSIESDNIDKDILFGKGVRIAKPSLMVNSFKGDKSNPKINLLVEGQNSDESFNLEVFPDNDDIHNAKWLGKRLLDNEDVLERINRFKNSSEPSPASKFESEIKNIEAQMFVTAIGDKNKMNLLLNELKNSNEKLILSLDNFFKINFIRNINDFFIYCLNTPALRGLTSQSHKDPVGIFGEGLDVLIANFDKEERAQLSKFSYMIDWLEDFLIDSQDVMKLKGYKLNRSKSTLYFADKYMARKNNVFSSENANEGILHVLFYLSVLISKRTPKFFAIDNIESCLNPHLCRHLMSEICQLAKENDKQLMITTHNPAILDGLNLHDDEIRLFEVKRNEKGHTVTKRIKLKPNQNGSETYKLSELWTRGFLGAISENY